MSQSKSFMQVDPADSMVVALEDVARGVQTSFGPPSSTVPLGHKMHIGPVIEQGDPLTLYGQIVGFASRQIKPYDLLTVTNTISGLDAKELTRYYEPWKKPAEIPANPLASRVGTSWSGFVREIAGKRKVGTRNDVWLISNVGCVNKTVEKLAAYGNEFISDGKSSVTGVRALTHSFGCSETKDNLQNRTQRCKLGHVAHPNAGAIVIVVLGCEDDAKFVDELLAKEGLVDDQRVTVFKTREFDREKFDRPEQAGKAIVRQAIEYASKSQRTQCHVKDLILGTKCGASGPFSGLTGNPLLGKVSDLFCSFGSTVCITEIPEFFGAVHIALQRASSLEVYNQMVKGFDDYAKWLSSQGEDLDTNPSAGNILAGLLTMQMKSLGALKKCGSYPIVRFAQYGEEVPAGLGGVAILYGPGGDRTAITTLAAAGTQHIEWVTQLGSPVGAMVPTGKIYAHSEQAKRDSWCCDTDAGVLANQGASWEAETVKLYNRILANASGQLTAQEENDEFHFSPWSAIDK